MHKHTNQNLEKKTEPYNVFACQWPPCQGLSVVHHVCSVLSFSKHLFLSFCSLRPINDPDSHQNWVVGCWFRPLWLFLFFFFDWHSKRLFTRGPRRAKRDKLAPVIDTLAKRNLIVIRSGRPHCRSWLWTVSEWFQGTATQPPNGSQHTGGQQPRKGTVKKTSCHWKATLAPPSWWIGWWGGGGDELKGLSALHLKYLGGRRRSRNETQSESGDGYLQRWF